jgi:DNA-binding response OmpR family regulator
MKVLIIDEEPDIRRTARLSLERWAGMVVVEAATAIEGIGRVESERPDLVLLDVMLADMSGTEALASIRRGRTGARVPVAFLTGISDREAVAALRATDVVDVLSKPFDPRELATRVLQIVSGEQRPPSARENASRALEQLSVTFRSSSVERLENLTRALDALELNPGDTPTIDHLRRQFHGLVGAGGTHGFLEITEIARLPEAECEDALRVGFASTERITRWREAVARLGSAVSHGTSPTLRPAALAALADLADEDDPDFVKDLVSGFLSETPELLERANEAITRHDTAEVTRLAHDLKSSAGNLGADRLASIAARLEECGGASDFADAFTCLDGLRREWIAVQRALEQHLEDFGTPAGS